MILLFLENKRLTITCIVTHSLHNFPSCTPLLPTLEMGYWNSETCSKTYLSSYHSVLILQKLASSFAYIYFFFFFCLICFGKYQDFPSVSQWEDKVFPLSRSFIHDNETSISSLQIYFILFGKHATRLCEDIETCPQINARYAGNILKSSERSGEFRVS